MTPLTRIQRLQLLGERLRPWFQHYWVNLLVSLLVISLWCLMTLWFSTTLTLSSGWMALQTAIGLYHALLAARILWRTCFENQRQGLTRFWIALIAGELLLLGFYKPGLWCGMLVAVLAPWFMRHLLLRHASHVITAGTQLTSQGRVKTLYSLRCAQEEDTGLLWGGVPIPQREATTHFMVVGTAGSGKTVTLRLLMQGIYQGGKSKRSLVYDAKRDTIPLLLGMGVRAQDIVVLNPFDARCTAWDMAKDLTRYRDAESLAAILIPEKENSASGDDFFERTSRDLLTGVTKLLIKHAPGRWALRDLVLALQSLEVTTTLLTADPEFRPHVTRLGPEKTAANVMATVASYIGQYGTVAAYLDRAVHRFSLRDWLASDKILLLGKDYDSDATLAPLNRLLFTRAAQLLLNQEETRDFQTALIFDELPSIGRLELLFRVANECRSKGVSLILGFQAYSNVEAVYGKELANGIVEQMDKVSFLRIRGSETAEWASNQIGNSEVRWKARSFQHAGGIPGNNFESSSLSEQELNKRAVMKEELQNLPKPDPATRTGLTGVYRIDQHAFRHTYASAEISQRLQPVAKTVAGFLATPDDYEQLRPWDESDFERLGFFTLFQNTLPAVLTPAGSRGEMDRSLGHGSNGLLLPEADYTLIDVDYLASLEDALNEEQAPHDTPEPETDQ